MHLVTPTENERKAMITIKTKNKRTLLRLRSALAKDEGIITASQYNHVIYAINNYEDEKFIEYFKHLLGNKAT